MRVPHLAALLVIAALAVPHGALAEPAPSKATKRVEKPFEESPPALRFSIEGLGAALLPGSIVHGTGLWVRGDRAGARNLLRLQGTALGVAAVSGGILASTGASRRVANLTIPFLVSGAGLFLQTWMADIYGTAGGGRRRAKAALGRARLSIEVGAVAVHDPQFDYNGFGRVATRTWIGPLRIAPEALIAIDDDNQRGRLEMAVRVWGPGSRRRSGDGSFLELIGGGRAHRYGTERFTAVSADVAIGGRVDFGRVGASLDGSFAELTVGYGIEGNRYKDSMQTADLSDLLLVRFGHGIYIGRPGSSVRGEVVLYYDHRRDEIAGGLSPGQQASGFLGHFGLLVDLDLGQRTGVVGSFEIGSAAVGSLAFRYHLGAGDRP